MKKMKKRTERKFFIVDVEKKEIICTKSRRDAALLGLRTKPNQFWDFFSSSNVLAKKNSSRLDFSEVRTIFDCINILHFKLVKMEKMEEK